MDVSFDLIKIFIYVAKYQSFLKAGMALHLTQSAVSQSITRLENNLSIKLFKRNKSGIELTNEGKLLYDEAQLGKRSFNLGIKRAKNNFL